jgi:hypothetical protein
MPPSEEQKARRRKSKRESMARTRLKYKGEDWYDERDKVWKRESRERNKEKINAWNREYMRIRYLRAGNVGAAGVEGGVEVEDGPAAAEEDEQQELVELLVPDGQAVANDNGDAGALAGDRPGVEGIPDGAAGPAFANGSGFGSDLLVEHPPGEAEIDDSDVVDEEDAAPALAGDHDDGDDDEDDHPNANKSDHHADDGLEFPPPDDDDDDVPMEGSPLHDADLGGAEQRPPKRQRGDGPSRADSARGGAGSSSLGEGREGGGSATARLLAVGAAAAGSGSGPVDGGRHGGGIADDAGISGDEDDDVGAAAGRGRSPGPPTQPPVRGGAGADSADAASALQRDLAHARAMNDLQAKRFALQESSAALMAEEMRESQARVAELEERNRIAEQDRVRLRERLRGLEKANAELHGENRALKEEARVRQEELDVRSKQNENLRSDMETNKEAHQADVVALQRQLQELRDQHKDLRIDHENVLAELFDATRRQGRVGRDGGSVGPAPLAVPSAVLSTSVAPSEPLEDEQDDEPEDEPLYFHI